MYKTRDFTFAEVVHRINDFPQNLTPIGLIAMGYVQALRDALWERYKKEIKIRITSGFRSAAYNKSLQGSSPTSYHVWRWSPTGQAIWAVDMVPDGLDLMSFEKFCKDFVRGETYRHKTHNIIHIAPFGPDEEW